MNRSRFAAFVLGVALLGAGHARAQIDAVQFHLYGGFTNLSKWHIQRVLGDYVDPSKVTFSTYVDENGKKHPWHTVMEVTPDGDRVNFYQVMHRIRDRRGPDDIHLYKTEVEATGDLRAHFGWTRRSIQWVPGWVQARGLVTSGLFHHVYVRGSQEKFVFHQNDTYDDMRLAPHRGNDVKIRGRVAGFDGPYPVVVLDDFEIVESPAGAVEVEPEDRNAPERPPRREKRENRAEDD